MSFIKLKNRRIFSVISILNNFNNSQIRIGLLDVNEEEIHKIFSNKNSICEISILDDNKKVKDHIENYSYLISLITLDISHKNISYTNPNKEKCIAKTITYVFLEHRKEE